MKFIISFLLSAVCFFCIVNNAQCARILAIISIPSYSHQIPYRPLWLELHRRGHEVVLVTSNPIPNINSTRFKQIDIGKTGYESIKTTNHVDNRFAGIRWLQFIQTDVLHFADTFADITLSHPEMQKLYAPDSNEKFDVLMLEILITPALYALASRFNAPMIGLSSLGLTAINEHALGGIVLPSHQYTWEMEANTGSNLPFWKRLKNFVDMSRMLYTQYSQLYPNQQKLAEKYLGPSIPPLLDIFKNTSLLFVNQADVLTPARPKLANVISFTSFHVSGKPTPLEKELKTFLDEATEGFIYFSLGSNARSSDLPSNVLQVFIDVFAKLPYRVVWKYEKELENKPDNVYIAPWFPQQSILAHPNIKLFMYQGGLQSTEETINSAVPVVGFPILADQDYQVGRMEALGVGKCLEIVTLKREELDSAIREVITNKMYKDNIIEMKKALNDHPYNIVEHLAWWTEYIIRHKGAPFFRSNLAWQPWYQRCDMDIVAFLTIVAFVIVSNTVNIIARKIIYTNKQWQEESYRKEKKKI